MNGSCDCDDLLQVSSVQFSLAIDRQRLRALISRPIRCGLCNICISTVAELLCSADEILFGDVVSYNRHRIT